MDNITEVTFRFEDGTEATWECHDMIAFPRRFFWDRRPNRMRPIQIEIEAQLSNEEEGLYLKNAAVANLHPYHGEWITLNGDLVYDRRVRKA